MIEKIKRNKVKDLTVYPEVNISINDNIIDIGCYVLKIIKGKDYLVYYRKRLDINGGLVLYSLEDFIKTVDREIGRIQGYSLIDSKNLLIYKIEDDN